MSQPRLETRKVFMIASNRPQRAEAYAAMIKRHFADATIYTSADPGDTLFKISNDPPDVTIVDMDDRRMSNIELSSKILGTRKIVNIALIIVSEIPDKEHFVDEVVTGKVQFLINFSDEEKFNQCAVNALNFLSRGQQTGDYTVKFLAPNEVLFSEGEKGSLAYILKRGEMKAVRDHGGAEVVLGQISAGEFVGEMAHISGQPRSATVVAVSDCELIEIPFGSLDAILFSKPAWSKALTSNLSMRLSRTNATVSKG